MWMGQGVSANSRITFVILVMLFVQDINTFTLILGSST